MAASSSPTAQLRHHFPLLIVAFSDLLQSLGSSDAARTNALMEAFFQRDSLFQSALRQFVQQLLMLQKIQEAQNEIDFHNHKIREFAAGLGALEENLYQISHPDIQEAKVSVSDLLAFSEKIAPMSFAAADYIEKKGLSNCRPPAPLEHQMALSKLQLSIEQLVQISQQRKAAESGEVAAPVEPAAAGEQFAAFLESANNSSASRTAQSAAIAAQAAALGRLFDSDEESD